MREWLSWWSTTLPRSGSRVRVPSRALHKSEYHLYARVAQLVEHDLAKVGVAGSSPVSRSSQKVNIIFIMREWLSWWSTTLPRSGSRVRVPSRALLNSKNTSASDVFFSLLRLDPARGFVSPFHSGRC